MDVLQRYYDEHASKRPSWQQADIAIKRLSKFYGASLVTAINSGTNLEYEMTRRREGAAWQTINRERMVLRAALNHARKNHGLTIVPHIPTIPEDHPDNKPVEPKGRPLTINELARLLGAAKSDHIRRFIKVLMGTMCRPDAAKDLTKAQLDFEHKLIRLNPPGRAQTKKYRPTVPMPPFLRAELKDVEDGHVIQYHGQPIASTKTAWRDLRKAAGLDKRVNAYSIRHTMARELRKRRVPAEQISIMLGHRPADTKRTDLIYAPYEPGYCREAAKALEAVYREIARKLRASTGLGRKGGKC